MLRVVPKIKISNSKVFHYFVLFYYNTLHAGCFYKISYFHSKYLSLKEYDFVNFWAWVSLKKNDLKHKRNIFETE